MSDGQQELYHGEQGLGGDGQQPPQQFSASGHEGSSSASPQSHKRKRDSIDDFEPKEEGGREGGTGARRTSIKQTSPNISVGGSFLPVNPNQTSANQFAYQPLNMAQPQGSNAINGNASTEAANAVLAAAGAMSSLMPQVGVAQSQGANFAEVGKLGEPQHVALDSGFNAMSPQPAEAHTEGVGGTHIPQQQGGHQQPAANPKPQVGTEEWHRVRRDNHKEVERRRRETINEGINELAKIVPGCEKNKGSILQRAVQYIQQLKEQEAQNCEKWTLEKLLTEQAIQELSQNNEKLKRDLDRVNRECETWKKTCLSNGLNREGGGGGNHS